ncbi:MAG: polysulfide reductase NrfD [Candidatus Eremiobacteraeota bacterium]|nr:polysulfide reductase NrfD [Candidatus Eremiobacteraeota bacterium]
MNPDYYGRPVLRAPHWGWNVVTYLFLGGVTGGLGIIAALADPKDESGRKLRKTARYTALAVAAVNPVILISHLGRPERFLHMLRTFKPGSPMSLGVWGLVAYSTVAAATTVMEDDRLTALQALLGAYLAGYTGVLLSATAVPLWGAGKIHIPAASVCSGVAGACALASAISCLIGNTEALRKLERFELVATAGEVGILAHFSMAGGPRVGRFVGRVAVPLALALGGNLIHAPKNARMRTLLASALTLTAGYLFRNALIVEGTASTKDPGAGFRQPQ